MTVQTEIDTAKDDAVMGQIVGELGAALSTLITALGVRTGLWSDMAGAGPLTPAELAERVGTAERAGFDAFEDVFRTGRGFGLTSAPPTTGPGAGRLTRSALAPDFLARAIRALDDVSDAQRHADGNVVVVGTHGTVVGTGLLEMQGGSVAGVVELVELVGPTTVVGGTAVVVVWMTVVVVVPVGPPEQPKDCNSSEKISATPGKLPNAVCTDRSSWQIGSRTAASCATGTWPPPVWAMPATGWPTSSATHTASTPSLWRQRFADPILSPFGPTVSSRRYARSNTTPHTHRRSRAGTGG